MNCSTFVICADMWTFCCYLCIDTLFLLKSHCSSKLLMHFFVVKITCSLGAFWRRPSLRSQSLSKNKLRSEKNNLNFWIMLMTGSWITVELCCFLLKHVMVLDINFNVVYWLFLPEILSWIILLLLPISLTSLKFVSIVILYREW